MFLILCSYVYLTCLPGFPTRFTDKDRCSNSLRIVYEYCAKTMGQSFNPDDLFTYSEEQVCVYPPHLDVHDLAVTACRWTEGCWFFVAKNKKTCGLSLKNPSCLHPFFGPPHSPNVAHPLPNISVYRGRAVAWWRRWSIPRPLASSRWRPRRWTTTGAMWNWRRSWTPSPGEAMGTPTGTLGDPWGLGGCCLDFHMLKDEKCWFYPDFWGVLCGV